MVLANGDDDALVPNAHQPPLGKYRGTSLCSGAHKDGADRRCLLQRWSRWSFLFLRLVLLLDDVNLKDIVAALTYLSGYSVVRFTHTKHWFDKTTEESGRYTFFDTWSKTDTILYRVYYPMRVIDSAVLHRPFERDKW